MTSDGTGLEKEKNVLRIQGFSGFSWGGKAHSLPSVMHSGSGRWLLWLIIVSVGVRLKGILSRTRFESLYTLLEIKQIERLKVLKNSNGISFIF